MAGKIKVMLDKLIGEKSKGDSIVANAIKVKLILKGIAVDKYKPDSADDPEIIKKIEVLFNEYQIKL